MSINSPDILSSKLSGFLGSKTTRWKYGDDILYKMCKKDPKHEEEDVVVGKIWLIGRSYAASVERRRNKDGLDTDSFYYDRVARTILSIGKKLDQNIAELNRDDSILAEPQLDLVLQTHKLLTDAFKDITGLEQRSLASKYLHFHCPMKFYIYDNIASQTIRKWVRKDKKRFSPYNNKEKFDVEYADYCIRIMEIQETSERDLGRMLTPREIDRFLLSKD